MAWFWNQSKGEYDYDKSDEAYMRRTGRPMPEEEERQRKEYEIQQDRRDRQYLQGKYRPKNRPKWGFSGNESAATRRAVLGKEG